MGHKHRHPGVIAGIGFWSATYYNLAAGALLIEIYTRWSGGFPWYLALGKHLTNNEVFVAAVVWVTLLGVVAEGIGRHGTLIAVGYCRSMSELLPSETE